MDRSVWKKSLERICDFQALLLGGLLLAVVLWVLVIFSIIFSSRNSATSVILMFDIFLLSVYTGLISITLYKCPT